MKRRFRFDHNLKEMVEIEVKRSEDNYLIMKDINPYVSMIDGSVITSRSKHRAHLKQHNCIELGNDSSIMNPKHKPLESPPGLKEEIIRAVEKHTRK